MAFNITYKGGKEIFINGVEFSVHLFILMCQELQNRKKDKFLYIKCDLHENLEFVVENDADYYYQKYRFSFGDGGVAIAEKSRYTRGWKNKIFVPCVESLLLLQFMLSENRLKQLRKKNKKIEVDVPTWQPGDGVKIISHGKLVMINDFIIAQEDFFSLFEECVKCQSEKDMPCIDLCSSCSQIVFVSEEDAEIEFCIESDENITPWWNFWAGSIMEEQSYISCSVNKRVQTMLFQSQMAWVIKTVTDPGFKKELKSGYTVVWEMETENSNTQAA